MHAKVLKNSGIKLLVFRVFSTLQVQHTDRDMLKLFFNNIRPYINNFRNKQETMHVLDKFKYCPACGSSGFEEQDEKK